MSIGKNKVLEEKKYLTKPAATRAIANINKESPNKTMSILDSKSNGRQTKRMYFNYIEKN